MTYNHLTKEQRSTIEYLLSLNKSFTYIGKAINADRTTVSKEIKRNRYIKSNFYNEFDILGINETINKCATLKSAPYVCNACPNKRYCINHKLYYNARIAQQNSDIILCESRSGIDIDSSVVDEIENSIVPLIKNQNQSVNQVYANHSDILFFSKTTFYRYIDLGVLSLTNLDLPKKVKYKKRKKLKNSDYKRKIAILKERTYKDYL